MKTILMTLCLTLAPLGLMGQSLTLPLGGIDLVIYGAKADDFRFGSSGDTIIFRPVEQAALDSAYLLPRTGVELERAEERLTVDFLQETLDYEPAFALGTPHDYTLHTEGGALYQLRGLEGLAFDAKHIARADAASRRAQTEYYKHFLAHKQDSPDLHPEYILEAEHFLRKAKTLPFDELRTMPTIVGRLITLHYREGGTLRRLILREETPSASSSPLEHEVIPCFMP